MAKRKTAAEPDYEPPLQGGSYIRTDAGELERREGTEAAVDQQTVEEQPSTDAPGTE